MVIENLTPIGLRRIHCFQAVHRKRTTLVNERWPARRRSSTVSNRSALAFRSADLTMVLQVPAIAAILSLNMVQTPCRFMSSAITRSAASSHVVKWLVRCGGKGQHDARRRRRAMAAAFFGPVIRAFGLVKPIGRAAAFTDG